MSDFKLNQTKYIRTLILTPKVGKLRLSTIQVSRSGVREPRNEGSRRKNTKHNRV